MYWVLIHPTWASSGADLTSDWPTPTRASLGDGTHTAPEPCATWKRAVLCSLSLFRLVAIAVVACQEDPLLRPDRSLLNRFWMNSLSTLCSVVGTISRSWEPFQLQNIELQPVFGSEQRDHPPPGHSAVEALSSTEKAWLPVLISFLIMLCADLPEHHQLLAHVQHSAAVHLPGLFAWLLVTATWSLFPRV